MVDDVEGGALQVDCRTLDATVEATRDNDEEDEAEDGHD